MKIGQRINHVKHAKYRNLKQILDTGTITAGPFRVPDEGFHYRVKWDSLGDSIMNELPMAFLSSRKYSYELNKNNQ